MNLTKENEMKYDIAHPAPQGATRVWHKGPPPHIGWWLTGGVEWRWWDGSVWSFYALSHDDAATARCMAAKPNKLYTGTWTDYYPAGARVPRVDPTLRENLTTVSFINMTTSSTSSVLWEDAAWKDYHRKHAPAKTGTDTPTVREMKERMVKPLPAAVKEEWNAWAQATPPVPPGYVAGSTKRLSDAVRAADADFSGAMQRNQDPSIPKYRRRGDTEGVGHAHLRAVSTGQKQPAKNPEARDFAGVSSLELMKELFRRFNATS